MGKRENWKLVRCYIHAQEGYSLLGTIIGFLKENGSNYKPVSVTLDDIMFVFVSGMCVRMASITIFSFL